MDAHTPTGEPSGQLVTYLRLLSGTPLPGQHFDVRSGGGAAPMRRWFVPATGLRMPRGSSPASP